MSMIKIIIIKAIEQVEVKLETIQKYRLLLRILQIASLFYFDTLIA